MREGVKINYRGPYTIQSSDIPIIPPMAKTVSISINRNVIKIYEHFVDYDLIITDSLLSVTDLNQRPDEF